MYMLYHHSSPSNSPWSIKLFTALPGCCPLHRMPFSNYSCMCTYSFIPRPKTMVIVLGDGCNEEGYRLKSVAAKAATTTTVAISNLCDSTFCSIKILMQKLLMKMSLLVDHKKAQSLPFQTKFVSCKSGT